jgi:hypothetical protein
MSTHSDPPKLTPLEEKLDEILAEKKADDEAYDLESLKLAEIDREDLELKALEKRVKKSYGSWVTTSYVVPFIQLCTITQNSIDKGAILFDIMAPETGEVIQLWLPKKCCSNLDMTRKIILVWEVIWDAKLEENPELDDGMWEKADERDYPYPKGTYI